MRDRSASESPMSVGTATIGVRAPRTPPSAWLADALQTLAELDDEIVEDGLPEIEPSVREEAERDHRRPGAAPVGAHGLSHAGC